MVSVQNIWVSIFLVLISLNVQAKDSTLLERRIQKVRTLVKELNTIPLPRFKNVSDTLYLMEAYKEFEPKYFAPPFREADFRIYMALGYLQSLTSKTPIDSFSLRYPDPETDSVVNVRELVDYQNNTLIAYFKMWGGEYEMFYFSFKEGTDQLIYLIEAGGEAHWYKRKKHFLDQLHSPRTQ